jgi:hypothetical protein
VLSSSRLDDGRQIIIGNDRQLLTDQLFDNVPALFRNAGEDASRRFVECFTANIRNRNTRMAYGQAVRGLFGFGPGLATDSERLYLNAGGGDANAGFIAIDKQSGATRWTSTDHAMAYTVPRLATIHGRRHLLALTETGLVSLDTETGDERWTFAFHAKAVDAINAVTPLIQDDLVLIVAGPGPGSVCLRIRPKGEYEKHWAEARGQHHRVDFAVVAPGTA